MIRTGVAELTVIPAIAYRQKLAKGGSGIVIIRKDTAQPAIASISKTSGEAIPTANTPANKYPKEAFAEALELTAGMPYRKLGGVKYADDKPKEIPDETSEALPEEVIVDGAEYKAVVDAYTDKNGRLSYELINRSMIKFAYSSSVVRKMINEMSSEKKIRDYTVSVKFRNITGNKELTEAQAQKILDMLDEVSPKGVLKEFNDEIRLRLKASKKNK